MNTLYLKVRKIPFLNAYYHSYFVIYKLKNDAFHNNTKLKQDAYRANRKKIEFNRAKKAKTPKA